MRVHLHVVRGRSAPEAIEVMLGAGLSLIEALDTLERAADCPRQAGPRCLSHRLRGGERLSDALAADASFSPLLLTGVGSAVLLYVMPRFARVFEGMTGVLPWSARAMVWWAQWLHANGLWLVGAAALFAAALAATIASPSARARALHNCCNGRRCAIGCALTSWRAGTARAACWWPAASR